MHVHVRTCTYPHAPYTHEFCTQRGYFHMNQSMEFAWDMDLTCARAVLLACIHTQSQHWVCTNGVVDPVLYEYVHVCIHLWMNPCMYNYSILCYWSRQMWRNTLWKFCCSEREGCFLKFVAERGQHTHDSSNYIQLNVCSCMAKVRCGIYGWPTLQSM